MKIYIVKSLAFLEKSKPLEILRVNYFVVALTEEEAINHTKCIFDNLALAISNNAKSTFKVKVLGYQPFRVDSFDDLQIIYDSKKVTENDLNEARKFYESLPKEHVDEWDIDGFTPSWGSGKVKSPDASIKVSETEFSKREQIAKDVLVAMLTGKPLMYHTADLDQFVDNAVHVADELLKVLGDPETINN